ncbi:hypothetical protein, partial [Bradyrhizobium sp. Mp27]|uniref:hypothetical protein n=1 Tax=Bradyrhizobium sp. Mp27 TaxID=3042157 RepID=UPI00248BE3E4
PVLLQKIKRAMWSDIADLRLAARPTLWGVEEARGLLNQPRRILPAQPDNAPHRALSGAPFGVEHLLAQGPGLRSDALG